MKLITPLNDQEVDKLSNYLQANNALDLSTIDGLFTALVSSPKIISPEQWLPVVFKVANLEDIEDNEANFTLLIRHLNGIESILSRAPDKFMPMFLERDLHDVTEVIVHNWCQGYVKGINLCADQWKAASIELESDLYPIIVSSKPKSRVYAEQPRETLLKLKTQIPVSARQLYNYWFKQREEFHQDGSPYVRTTPKIGRNDLCHCGSGRKYKLCCGAH
jgi:uncharacterized protein